MFRSAFRRSALGALAAAAFSFGLVGSAVAATWTPFVIRGTPTIDTSAAPTIEFLITTGGDKAGLGTADLDGTKLNQITKLSINRVDDHTRFTAGSGPYVAPYLNFWVTDPTGTKFAVIANEPSNPEWTVNPGSMWDMTWDQLKTKTAKVFENNDKSWLPNNGVGLTFADLGNFTIMAPSVAQLTTGWAGLGSGAPDDAAHNAYGINWVFGDTLSNYVSGQPGYKVNNAVALTAVPLPAAALGALPLLALTALKRRRA